MKGGELAKRHDTFLLSLDCFLPQLVCLPNIAWCTCQVHKEGGCHRRADQGSRGVLTLLWYIFLFMLFFYILFLWPVRKIHFDVVDRRCGCNWKIQQKNCKGGKFFFLSCLCQLVLLENVHQSHCPQCKTISILLGANRFSRWENINWIFA
jgi:hypothetical protein